MKKRTFSAVLFGVVFSLLLFSEQVDAVVVSWLQYTGVVDALRIYRSDQSQVCSQEHWDVPSNTTSFTTSNPVKNGIYFMNIEALKGADKSGLANELALKYCGGVNCYANFSVVPGYDYVYLNFETVLNAPGYQVKYTRDGGAETSVDIIGPEFIYNLPVGMYVFRLYPKDALGRVMMSRDSKGSLVESNLYQPQQIALGANTPPSPPLYEVESLGSSATQKVVIGFKEDNPQISYFKVNIYSTSALRNTAMTSKAPGDIASDVHVAYGQNYCKTLTNTIVFTRVTAVDKNGNESGSTASYRLMGDILNTAFSNDPSQSAVIDAVDKAEFLLEYKKYSIVRYTDWGRNYCIEPDLYNKMPLDSAIIADYNQDGLVGTWDYKYFLSIMGRTGAGK